MKQNTKTKSLVLLGLLAAILIVMAYTPLGYLKVGALAITFNTIPVAIGALALGPLGGAVAGGVFGLTSFLNCFGGSTLGATLLNINPVLTAVLCLVPRILEGLLAGLIANSMRKRSINDLVTSCVTGFMTAFLNTLLYMTTLVLFFGKSDIIQSYWDTLAKGKNVLVFVCLFVGINAVVEWISTTVITGAVGTALSKARLLPGVRKAAAE